MDNHWKKENMLPSGIYPPRKVAWYQAAKLPVWMSVDGKEMNTRQKAKQTKVKEEHYQLVTYLL
jgi:hypothetical protein